MPLDTAIDTSFHELHPPLIQSLDAPPPQESDAKVIEDVAVEADDVRDPDYAWEDMEHDTDEGFARWKALREKKAEEVAGYVLRRSKYWAQTQSHRFFPDDITIKVAYGRGSSVSTTSDVKTSLEVELGLTKGIFSGKLKGSVTFDDSTTKTFSQWEEYSQEVTHEGGCFYFYWQMLERFEILRRPAANPAQLEPVSECFGVTELSYTDKFKARDGAELAKPLMVPAKTLKKGERRKMKTWLVGQTKFTVKNISIQESGEATLRSGIFKGKRHTITLEAGKTETYSKAFIGGKVIVINSGVHDIEVWNDV